MKDRVKMRQCNIEELVTLSYRGSELYQSYSKKKKIIGLSWKKCLM